MPRRRISCRSSGRCGGLCVSKSVMVPEQGYHGRRGIDLVAERRLDRGVLRKVHVDARPEADEAEALSAMERGTLVHVAQDAPRDQPRDLDAGHVGPGLGMDPQRIALVLETGLVERG